MPAAPNKPVAGAGAGAAAVDPAVEVVAAVADGVEDDVAVVVAAAKPEPKLGGLDLPAGEGAGVPAPAPKPVAVTPVSPPAVEAGAEAWSSVGLCTLLDGPEASEAGASGRLAAVEGTNGADEAAVGETADGHKRKSVERAARNRRERMPKEGIPGGKRWQASNERNSAARGGAEHPCLPHGRMSCARSANNTHVPMAIKKKKIETARSN